MTKRSKPLSVLVIAALVFMACEKKNVILSDDYLPLEVGNYWKLEFIDTTRVTGTTEIGGKEYYILETPQYSTYYRVENGKVYVSTSGEKGDLKFNLTADAGDDWMYGEYVVTLHSKTDTVVVGDTPIPDCYHFGFDVPGMCDEEHSIWLAPGIGFIRKACGFCLNPNMVLVEAMIGGEAID
ncbi:MAG: hypothetical protein JW801_05765 [Bacteroidales bacterium]|nr:hypothetical protein [Bacteroidales bacterium]